MAAEKILVAAIDFGTTFSSWAFSFRHDYESNPTKIYTKSWNNGKALSPKAPTTVLILPDGKTFEAFGFNAEDRYAELAASDEHREWYYFRRFKMALYDDRELNRRKEIEDEMGKKLPAMTVISLAIDHLRKDLLSECSKQILGGMPEGSIQWVLTVPAIWNDKARRFMREAAMQAGIQEDHLIIALEPEAASLYCRHIPLKAVTSEGKIDIVPLSKSTRYIVIDAGGGTIDITIHEVLHDGKLKEIHKATGGAWGGQEVDECFKQFLIKIFGGRVVLEFKKEAMDDYLSLFRDFEVKKRNVVPNGEGKCIMSLPLTLVETFEKSSKEKLQETITQTPFASKVEILKGNKLRIDNSLMRHFFDKAVEGAANHIQTFHDSANQYNISVALLVGGFSESPMLASVVKSKCPSWNVVVPDDAGLVVLKGAVLFGHDPSSITYRVCRYTYGKRTLMPFKDGVHPTKFLFTTSDGRRYCDFIFKQFIIEGTLFKAGDIVFDKMARPNDEEKDYFDISIYASTDKDANYTKDDCCTYVGKLRVDQLDINKSRKERKCRIIVSFGNTEIHVESIDDSTGRKLKTSFDSLD